MGQKVHPLAFRLGVHREWASRWFARRSFRQYLKEDVELRTFLRERLRRSYVTEIRFERLSGGKLQVTLRTARPGMLIGRGGGGIEEIKKAIQAQLRRIRGKTGVEEIRIEVQEVRDPDGQAVLLAQSIADQLERRMPFRRVLKRALERALVAKGVEGARLAIGGRLGGAEMKRREWAQGGKVPLHTIRADIDYAQEEARTTWGVIGVKVWLYKGEVFSEKSKIPNSGSKRFGEV
ncbi:MAG: 30S ribosomal protein S3 [Candidatus Terrybacteria bacterium]|nr:30S ribosomal protein S3 [Candidatus Terrybacteria bacterium]